ncbi:ATP-binding protein, partial [Haloferula chungangensis]
AAAFGMGLSVVIAVVVLALRQPSIGLSFVPSANGESVLVQSPELEEREVTGMVWEGGRFELLPLDLTVEPDGAMGDYASYDTFLSRQQTLSEIQRADRFTLLTEQGEIPVQPSQSGRSFFSLPKGFWVQIVVGLLAFLVSAGVFAFRSGSAAARYLLFSGAATLLFAPAAALYSTRELALPGELFRWANDLNFLGGSLFAASFVALLLHYPRKLAPWWVGFSVVCLFVVWWVAQQVGVFESMTFARRFLVMIAVLATFILAGLHWFGTRRDPVGRAALKWFLLSWVLGTGLFAVGILLPQLFGVDTSRLQGYAFLLFILVYAGLAFGILRYRLFDLGEWWRQILIWGTVVLLLVTLYFSLVTGLQLPPGLSLALALLLGGVFRIIMRNRLRRREGPRREDLFASVLDVAFGPDDGLEKRWKELLAGLFHPLGLEVARPSPRSVTIADDGASMLVPGIGTAAAILLEFPEKGGRLFSQADAALATESRKMLQHALESRESYERGVTEERSRIALDIHDNIASGLLTALHSPDAARKDQCIRDTMTEIREMIRNAASEGLTLEEALAELRVETAERLAAADITLAWRCDEIPAEVLGSAHVHALRSVIREAVSNIIKHSAASHAEVSLSLHGKTLELKVSDNGRGFDPSQESTGSGLANFRERLRPFSGEVELASSASGTLLSARMELKVEDRRV